MNRLLNFRRAVVGLCQLCVLALLPYVAMAHELQPGFLQLIETTPHQYDVLWKQPTSLGNPLRLTPVFPAGCQAANAAQSEVLPQSWVWRMRLSCPKGLAGQMLSIEGLEAFATDVLIRIEHGDGRVETHLLKPVDPSVTLNEVAQSRGRWTYLTLGVEHIALGVDHLLFVFGLLLIVRNRWMLIKTITSFTLAHSITLAIATLGSIQLPTAPLEALIALSILFLAPEAIRVMRGGVENNSSLTISYPWLVAFTFGLLHGFAFASGLATLGVPQDDIAPALLLFNLGVELGQLSFVLLFIAVERGIHLLKIHWPRWVEMIPVYTLGTLGAFWTIQRVAVVFLR
ncbi:MAG: HupE/UreJ family protein [Rhodocyclaceae bacterium]|nr:HupE/UreJ family protein [Rhodocyclaceae bacterium]